MRDHSFDGVPIFRMRDYDIRAILIAGDMEINDSGGLPLQECKAWILLRLEIELLRRGLGLPIRGE